MQAFTKSKLAKAKISLVPGVMCVAKRLCRSNKGRPLVFLHAHTDSYCRLEKQAAADYLSAKAWLDESYELTRGEEAAVVLENSSNKATSQKGVPKRIAILLPWSGLPSQAQEPKHGRPNIEKKVLQ